MQPTTTQILFLWENKKRQMRVSFTVRKTAWNTTSESASTTSRHFVLFLTTNTSSARVKSSRKCAIFLMFHRTDFSIAIQQLNSVEKNSVAVSLMVKHNLTGLYHKHIEITQVSVTIRYRYNFPCR